MHRDKSVSEGRTKVMSLRMEVQNLNMATIQSEATLYHRPFISLTLQDDFILCEPTLWVTFKGALCSITSPLDVVVFSSVRAPQQTGSLHVLSHLWRSKHRSSTEQTGQEQDCQCFVDYGCLLAHSVLQRAPHFQCTECWPRALPPDKTFKHSVTNRDA